MKLAQVEADMQRTSYSPKGKFDDSKYDGDDNDDDDEVSRCD